MNGGGRLPHDTGTMYFPDGSKPCMEAQGMSSAHLVAFHCYIPVRVTSLGAGQDAELKRQAALQGDAHEGRVNAAKRVVGTACRKAPAKGCEMDMKAVACLRDVAVT
eukprot:6206626-Pleurochrysis_carterae.AAC.2